MALASLGCAARAASANTACPVAVVLRLPLMLGNCTPWSRCVSCSPITAPLGAAGQSIDHTERGLVWHRPIEAGDLAGDREQVGEDNKRVEGKVRGFRAHAAA